MKNNNPKISFIVLTFNNVKSLKRTLLSIKKQNYPKEKIEIIVVDNGSKDDTVKVAKSFGAKVIMNTTDNLYRSLAIAYHAASGSFAYQLDQDEEMRYSTFLQKMLKPFMQDGSIGASFTRNYPNREMSWITRFLSYHPAQLDPLYEFFSPSLKDTISESRKGYLLCNFSLKKVPGCGHLIYKLEFLKKSPIWNQKYFSDQETLSGIIAAGFTKFAYVPDAGYYHYHADSLSHLLTKRIRNLKGHYLKVESPYKWKWFDTASIKGIMKILLWIVYANLFIPATIRGIIRAIKFRDLVLLAEPVVTIVTTDVILYNFLTLSEGRTFIKRSFGWLIK